MARLLEISGVIECEILKRLNRFVVEVLIDGARSRAYISNTGRLMEYIVMGKKGFCIKNPRVRKTDYRLFAVSDRGLAALIDTQMQMRTFEEAVKRGVIPWLAGYKVVKRNVKLGSSLVDYLLSCDKKLLFLEVKSAVLRGNYSYAMYPDCPTIRGRRHIRDIMNHVKKGGSGGILFIAALPYVEAFKPYGKEDPEIPKLLQEAYKLGVLIKAISMHYDPSDSAIHMDCLDLKVILNC